MSKARIPISPPAQVGGIIQARLDAAQNYLALQKHSNKWKPLLASVPVGFMDLRTGMCRWPIDDFRTIWQPSAFVAAHAPCRLLIVKRTKRWR